jgi:flagellar basal body P-ring protein FlgI
MVHWTGCSCQLIAAANLTTVAPLLRVINLINVAALDDERSELVGNGLVVGLRGVPDLRRRLLRGKCRVLVILASSARE